MQYHDKNGREYIYRPTLGVLRRAERRSGASIFSSLAGILKGADANNINGEEITRRLMACDLSRLDTIGALLFESLPEADRSTLRYDDFMDLFELHTFTLLLAQTLGETFKSFVDETSDKPESGGRDSGPKGRLPGETSTESSPSPEPAPKT